MRYARIVQEKRELQELKTEPGPLVKSTLIKASLSGEFDEAKTEWELLGNISSDTKDFVENCELCNHKNYKQNWLISNLHTKTTLKVGSECIKRFIILKGTGSQQASNHYFQLKEQELKEELELYSLYTKVVTEILPLKRHLNRFIKVLKGLLEKRGQLHLKDSQEGIKEIFSTIFRKNFFYAEKDIARLDEILNNPGKILTQTESKKYREFKYKEGQTWQRQKKVTNTTLAPSEAFRTDHKYR